MRALFRSIPNQRLAGVVLLAWSCFGTTSCSMVERLPEHGFLTRALFSSSLDNRPAMPAVLESPAANNKGSECRTLAQTRASDAKLSHVDQLSEDDLRRVYVYTYNACIGRNAD